MALLETDSLSNQNISSALEVGSYTANAARKMFVRLFADQVAGNGDYVAYLTIQRGGSGSAYRVVPTTTATVASGVTAIALITVPFFVTNTDVVKAYLVGLAGDTTTPDTIVEWWEEVQQTGDAYARLGAPAGASVSADIAAVATSVSGVAAAAATAVWAAGTRTLTSFGTLVADVWSYVTREITGGGGSASDIWAYATRTLTQAAASVASAVSGSLLTIHRGDTWSATLTGLASNTGYSKIWFTVKEARGDADTDAIIQILLTSPPAGTDGLQRLNGATATAAQGSITVNSATSLTLALDEAATAHLAAARNLVYDVQYLISSAVSTATDGNCKITDDVTRATS